jgi:FMN phosphatase YigB (HAD superfamily)/DNA-binding XRE family transcriptional regulator
MDEVGLGKLLQDARRKAGLTQQALCHKAGLSYSTLAKIERGAIKSPSVFTIQSIAAALNVTLNDLLGISGPDNQSIAKKRSKSGIRFVFFDINGCLVRFYHRAFTRIAEDSGKQSDIVETTFWHYNDAVCRGEMPMDEFNRILGEQFEMPGFLWQTYYLAAIEPIEEMRDLAAWACEHYYVGLLSNIMPGLINTMLERDLLPKVSFAAVIDSSEVNAIKPESKIYEIAQEKAGVSPEEILLVDDSRSNIMAAQRFGWKVMWFDDYRPAESVARIRTALEPED